MSDLVVTVLAYLLTVAMYSAGLICLHRIIVAVERIIGGSRTISAHQEHNGE